MIALIRSLAYMLAFYGGSAIIVPVGFLFIFSGQGFRHYVRFWAWYHEICVRYLLGIRLKITGAIPSGSVLVVSKHQSAYETIALVHLLHEPVIVLKSELAAIPLWGKLARIYGMIPVDRSGSSKALRAMIKSADTARQSGRPIVIFPEGTRVPPGEAPPLQAGFAGLYRHLGLPAVPLAIDAGRLWPRRGLIKQSGTIHFHFGEPLPPGLPRAEAERLIHAAINRDPVEV